jgi:hypothetical protein
MPVLAAVAAVLLALWIGTSIRGSVSGAWLMLHVPAISPLFADTRTITHSIDCLRAGQDPYSVRTFDPWHRLYNYPPIWLDLRYLGVSSSSSNLLGCLFATMTVSALLLLFRARTWLSSLVVLSAVTSAAVLFAVERGNTDQVIFFLLVLGLFLFDRVRPDLKPFLKGALIVLLTALKIFPVAAAALLVRNRKGAVVALLTAALSIAALVITCGRHIPQVLANTPQDVYVSFGSLPFFLGFFTLTSHPLLSIVQHHAKAASLGALILAILSVAAGASFRKQLDYFFPPLDFDDARGCIAVAGLAIFCIAFVRGTSFDYRLIFLLGAIAYLVEDLNKRTSLRTLPAAILFVLLLWKPTEMSNVYELVDGLVFIAACAWLGTSLLDRLRIAIPAPRAEPPV